MATGDPNEALRAYVSTRRKPAPAGPNPNDALRAYVSTRQVSNPNDALASFVSARKQTPPVQHQQPSQFIGGLQQSRQRAEEEQAKRDALASKASVLLRGVPVFGNELANLVSPDPVIRELRGTEVLGRASQAGGGAINELTGQPHLEAQASDTLGPYARHGAQQQGQSLADLAAVPPTSTGFEDLYGQELNRAGRAGGGGVSPEQAQAIAEYARAVQAAEASQQEGRYRAGGFADAENMGPRAISLAMGASAATPTQHPAKRPVQAQDISNLLAAEQADAEQTATDRFISGSRTPLPFAYEAAREAGMSPVAGVATEIVSDPLTWLDLAGKPAVAGVQAGRRFLGDLAEVGGDVARGFERGVAEHGTELTRPAAGFADPQGLQKLRTAREIAEAQTVGHPRAVTPEPSLPTAQEAARRRVSLQEQEDAAQAALRARQAEVAAQERLAELAPGEKPSLVLPEQRVPQPIEVVSNGPRAVRETISPARDAEIAQQVAEGQAREAEILARREAELANQPRSSTLEIPGQTAPGRITLPGEAEAGSAARKLIVPGQEPDPNAALREFINGRRGETATPRRITLPEQTPPASAAAEAVHPVDPDDYINRRAFGEVPESPVYNDLQRVQREMADIERERMLVERRGAGQLSREERTANMRQSDALRQDAQRLQERHDGLRRVADQDAYEFRQAYLRGEAQIPGPASLEQGYAPQSSPTSLEMGTPQPQPGVGRGVPPGQTTLPMPTPTPLAPRKTLGDVIRTALGRPEKGQVKNVPQLIRNAAATLDKMTGTKSVYGMGKGAHARTPARFLSRLNLVEIKRGNMTGFWHEVGHAFDEMAEVVAPWWNKSRTRPEGKFSRRPELAAELDALGSTGHSSWQPGMGSLRQRQEGMAEFARIWMEDPAAAQRQAPQTYAAFEKHLDEMGDLGSEWRRHQDDLQLRMQSDEAAQSAAHVVERPDQKWRIGTIEETVDGFIDRFNPLKAIDEARVAFRGARLQAEDSIYLQARLLKNLSNLKVQEFQVALKEALKPINDMGATASRNFQTWLVARHAAEMERAGLATGRTEKQWQALIDAYDSPEFRAAADSFKAWQKSINEYAVEHGNLDPLKVEGWEQKWEHYVPTNRELENVIGQMDSKAGFAAGTGKGLKASRGPGSWLHRKKGGQQAIFEPIETSLQNMQSTVHSTERNRLAKMLAESYDQDMDGLGQFVREIKPGDKAGRNTMTVRDGDPTAGTYRERVFEFTSERFFKAYAAMDEKALGGLVRFLSLPAGLLRWGATKISAPFIANNIQRDTMEATVNSRRTWAAPLVQSFDGLYTTIRAHLGDAKAKEAVEAFLQSGGHQGIDEMFANPTSARKLYRDTLSSLSPTERALSIVPKPVRAGIKGVGTLAVSPFKILETLSNLSEQATRVGEFKATRELLQKQHPNWSAKSIDQQAGFEAMDLLDFDLRGNNEIIRTLRSIVPFAGSSMTGTYRNLQAFKESPKLFTGKALAFLTVPTLALWSINRNNPYYNEKTQDDRDQNWFVPMPAPVAKALGIDNPAEQFFRLKKPFLMGTIAGAMPERFFSHLFDKDPDAAKGLLEAIVLQSTPAGAQDLGGPGMRLVNEVAANYDNFSGRDIEPEWLRSGPGEVAPYMRSDEYSTITARMLSKGMHNLPLMPNQYKLSPMMIDHIIKGAAGSGGQAVVKGEMFGQTPGLDRYGIDPLLSALTGEEEAKASRKQYLGIVPTEGRHESEDRFKARLSELRWIVHDSDNPESKKLRGKLNQYESTAKRLKEYYKKRAEAKDEAQRMRWNRMIVRETERLEPPIPRQKELRQK